MQEGSLEKAVIREAGGLPRIQGMRALSSKDLFFFLSGKKAIVGKMKNVRSEERPRLPPSESVLPLAVGSKADSW